MFVIESTSSTSEKPIYLTENRGRFGSTFGWTASLVAAIKFDTQPAAQTVLARVSGGRIKELTE